MSETPPPSGPETTPDAASPRTGYTLVAAVLIVLGLMAAVTIDGRPNWAAPASLLNGFLPAPAAHDPPDTSTALPPSVFTLRDHQAHPDKSYGAILNGAVPSVAHDTASLTYKFQELLALFRHRQAVDDNFTIRVLDNRSGEVLEIVTLENERAAYRRGASVDWRAIDNKRRRVTRQLVDKYEARGIPNEAITVKWGRANQVKTAHERAEPFAEYEIRLANYLDLSLLPLGIGTVETFNQDHLVSSVGARSRYQMMPLILRRNGIHRYTLATTGGASVRVKEELHPLLTMEPAFLLLRGYINAVGHEIPGISAYHTGPGNIYTVYRLFLTESDGYFKPSASVVDAYMWAVTEGFETVRGQSTFGPYSRGYVASVYGSLTANDERPIDSSKTLHAARVQLKLGATATLRDILDALASSREPLQWGPAAEGSLYARFRHLNPHIDLPPGDSTFVPDAGNVRFRATTGGKAVRFFLPLGAPAVLKRAGVDVLNDAATFRFDDDTYAPASAQPTRWDRAYDALVHDIGRFGFTKENREELLRLYERFQQMAEANPSAYRQRQLQIIETHRRIWISNPWEQLAPIATMATGRASMPVEPPMVLETNTSLPGPSSPQ